MNIFARRSADDHDEDDDESVLAGAVQRGHERCALPHLKLLKMSTPPSFAAAAFRHRGLDDFPAD